MNNIFIPYSAYNYEPEWYEISDNRQQMARTEQEKSNKSWTVYYNGDSYS